MACLTPITAYRLPGGMLTRLPWPQEVLLADEVLEDIGWRTGPKEIAFYSLSGLAIYALGARDYDMAAVYATLRKGVAWEEAK